MTRRLLVCALLLLAVCGNGDLDRLKTGERGRVVQVRSGDTLMLDVSGDPGGLVRLRADIRGDGRIQIRDRQQVEILRDKPPAQQKTPGGGAGRFSVRS